MTRTEKYNAVKNTLELLEKNLFQNVVSVKDVMTGDGIKVKSVPYGCRKELFEDTSKWDSFEIGSAWGEPDTHYLFQVEIDIPESYKGKEVLFFLSTGAEDIWNTDNPQMLVYINGKRRCGMDMNHNSLTIYEKADWDSGKDRHVDIRIYAYSNLTHNGNLLNMTIAARNEAACQLYFDMKVPFEAMQAMLGIPSSKRESVLDTTAGAFEEQNKNVEITEETFTNNPQVSKEQYVDIDLILDELYTISSQKLVDNPSEIVLDCGKLLEASNYLRENLYGKNLSQITVESVGHTHIDVAWKWQIRQTREKVIRSYSTVMELMKKYPEYRFMASTPQMYEFVKEEEPELFEEIKEKVKEGRFEPEGAMWLEADCNLTSGESLVRQILYGKEYFEKEFGIESKVLWLPDVFGYSAALPQILTKSGVKAFMTTKLAWNDTNRMPNDLFIWKGIDGSSIPTYIITTCDYDKAKAAAESGGILNYTYNGRQNASQTMGTWEAFRDKSITDDVLTVYGYGDGGGGPTWEMLEMDRRLRLGVPGVPRTTQSSVTEFFDKLVKEIDGNGNVATWDGELYLEYHRGTYSSIGKNKKNNRKAEYLMAEAELLSVYAYLLKGSSYPKEEIKKLWETVMLNQFHDILPGSSIEAVYEDSDKDYAKIQKEVQSLIDAAWKEVEAEQQTQRNGSSAISFNKNGVRTDINTRFYNIVFDENAEIISLHDKESGRELRDDHQHPLNRLIAFEDKPKEYDCWNIDSNFEDVSWNITEVKDVTVIAFNKDGKKLSDFEGNQENGDIAELVVEVIRQFRNSEIKQKIHFYADSRRIDFETKIDWNEHQTLLKAAFPVNIHTDEITCEIQYGNLKRSLKRDNSWDKAKFECCAHKWIDISDDDGTFGVALLNDSKYGYDAKENLMRLTLIKSGIFPNPNADQGIHEFTYSLFPHEGDYAGGKVIEEARALNEKSHLYKTKDVYDELCRGILDLQEDGIFVEAVKFAENSDDIIVRLYEGYGKEHNISGTVFGKFSVAPKDARECDLLENEEDGDNTIFYNKDKKEISFKMKPFEIKTLKFYM
jgi:alpha-mannosidase